MSKSQRGGNRPSKSSSAHGTLLPGSANPGASDKTQSTVEAEPQATASPSTASGTDRPAVYGTQAAPPIARQSPPQPGSHAAQSESRPSAAPRKLPSQQDLRAVTATQVPPASGAGVIGKMTRAHSKSVSFPDLDNITEPEGFATAPDDDSNVENKAQSEGGAEGKTVQQRSRRRVPGKSTWNLRIKQRGVAGHISGIINEIPLDPSKATGLQSALTVDNSAAEYDIIDELGAGNMGIVYRARQTSLNRELAIKTLKPDSTNAEYDQAMFVSEAVVTANLVHPNIVPIHDLGRTEDGKLFYSMKQVNGIPWQNTIRENSAEANLEIFLKVCDAVAYAHSRGVVNRDLKPENVIVGSYGEVIVLDWGLAITTSAFAKKDSVIVDFRGGGGTPAYMAPELLDEDVSRVGPHSDIYLLGAILFELLEGIQPHCLRKMWDSDDPEEQMNIVLWAVMQNEIEPDVQNDGELMQIALKAMSTQPEDRYDTVEELQEAIREYRITGRAEELMLKVEQKGTSTYTEYQSAVALYEEALRKWPSNRRAQDGNKKARLAYAELAQKKGDIDLGLQVIPSDEDRRFQTVRKKLKRTKRTRSIIRATWSLLLVSAIGLSAFLLLTQAELRNGRTALAQQEIELDQKTKLAAKKTAEAKAATEVATAKTEEANEAEARILAAKADLDKAMLALQEAKQTNLDLAHEIGIKKKELDTKTKEAETATKAAEDARTQLEAETRAAIAAKAEAEEAKKLTIIARFDGLTERINAMISIRDYGRVSKWALEAEKLGERHDFIGEEKIEAIKKQRLHAIEAMTGHSAIQRPGHIEHAIISRNGTTLVTDTRDENAPRDAKLMVFRDRKLADSAPSHGLPLKFTGRKVRDLSVSSSGDVICVVDDQSIHVWQWNGTNYHAVNVTQPTEIKQKGLKLEQGLVSDDGLHVFVIARNRFTHVLAWSLQDNSGQHQATVQLEIEDDDFNGVRDAVLPPDKSVLIVALGDGSCRAIPLKCDGANVQIAGRVPGNVIGSDFPALSGLDDLGTQDEGGRNGRFQPRTLSLSRDGSELVLTEGNRFFVVPQNKNARADEFPYRSPKQLAGFATTTCNHDGIIRAMDVSKDGQTVITAQGEFIQVWKKRGNAFTLAEIPGLLIEKYVAGHSHSISTLAFEGTSSNYILSVGQDNVVRRWNLDEYGNYVAGFEQMMDELEALADPDLSVSRSAPGVRVPHENRKPSRYILTSGPQPPNQLLASQQPPQIRPPSNAKRFRQARHVYSAEFSNDDSRLVVGADDLAAHSFNSVTAEQTLSAHMLLPRDPFFAPERNNFLEGHVPEIVSMTFLPPDGKQLLTLDYFGSISVWDAFDDENGIGYELSRPLPSEPVNQAAPGQPYEVEDSYCDVAVSPDGKYVIAGGVRNDGNTNMRESKDEYFAALWKVDDFMKSATPGPYRELRDVHDWRITAAAFSPDGTKVITAGRRGRFALWDFENNKVLAMAEGGHGSDGVSGVFFVSDDTMISAGFDGNVFRWTIDGDKLIPTAIQRDTNQSAVPDYIIRMRPSPDRSQFITSDLTKDPKTGVYLLKLNSWSSQDGWQATLPVDIEAPLNDLGSPYRHDISWADDSKQVLFVHDKKLLILDSDGWKVKEGLQLPATESAIRGAFAPLVENELRIATFDGRFASLWNVMNGDLITRFRSHLSSVRAGFSSDRRFVVTASDSIRVFNSDESSPDHGRPLFRLSQDATGHTLPADAAFSPIDGDYRFASIDAAGTISLWDWGPGMQPPKTPVFKIRPDDIDADDARTLANSLCWSDDRQLLASTHSGKVRLWKVQGDTLQPVPLTLPKKLYPEDLTIDDIDFSSNGQLLVAGGVYDRNAYGLIWKIANGAASPVAEIDAEDRHEGIRGITAIVINDVTNEVVSGGADSRLQRWQIGGTDNDELTVLPWIGEREGRGPNSEDRFTNPHSSAITSLDTAADGRFVSTDEDGWIVIWPSQR